VIRTRSEQVVHTRTLLSGAEGQQKGWPARRCNAKAPHTQKLGAEEQSNTLFSRARYVCGRQKCWAIETEEGTEGTKGFKVGHEIQTVVDKGGGLVSRQRGGIRPQSGVYRSLSVQPQTRLDGAALID
jgi:hypothetical protein